MCKGVSFFSLVATADTCAPDIAAIFIPLIIQLSLFIGAPNNNSREVPKPGVIITSIAATVLLAAQFWPVGMQALKFLVRIQDSTEMYNTYVVLLGAGSPSHRPLLTLLNR